MNVDQFELAKWAQENELEEKTVEALVEKGFKSYKTLSLLNEEDARRMFKGLVPGQLLLLINALGLFDMNKDTASANVPPAGDQPSASQTANQTDIQAASVQPPSTSQPEKGIDEALAALGLINVANPGKPRDQSPATDPYCLGSGPYGAVFGNIRSHITSWQQREESKVDIGGVTFTMAGQRKVPYEKIRLNQYMEGSLSVLRTAIIEESLSTSQVIDHVNYLIQIARFANSFEWASVLRYDELYRQQQQKLGFRWGTSSPILMQTQLRLHQSPVTGNTAQSKKTVPVCRKWNSRMGCSMANCSYTHTCLVCASADHPQYKHQDSTAPKN